MKKNVKVIVGKGGSGGASSMGGVTAKGGAGAMTKMTMKKAAKPCPPK